MSRQDDSLGVVVSVQGRPLRCSVFLDGQVRLQASALAEFARRDTEDILQAVNGIGLHPQTALLDIPPPTDGWLDACHVGGCVPVLAFDDPYLAGDMADVFGALVGHQRAGTFVPVFVLLRCIRESHATRSAHQQCVYFAQETPTGRVKIGVSGDYERRVHGVSKQTGHEYKTLAVVPGNKAVETAIHERFAHLRLGGEWFRPGDDLMAFIATLAVPTKSRSLPGTDGR